MVWVQDMGGQTPKILTSGKKETKYITEFSTPFSSTKITGRCYNRRNLNKSRHWSLLLKLLFVGLKQKCLFVSEILSKHYLQIKRTFKITQLLIRALLTGLNKKIMITFLILITLLLIGVRLYWYNKVLNSKLFKNPLFYNRRVFFSFKDFLANHRSSRR